MIPPITVDKMVHRDAFDSRDELYRPCVDCGKKTGNYCPSPIQLGHGEDQGGECFAEDRVPSEPWAEDQKTPLCEKCYDNHGSCHFCRQVHSCTPFTWEPKTRDSSDFDSWSFIRFDPASIRFDPPLFASTHGL